MQLNTLKRKNPNYKSTAVGRGGKRGKTSGRGTKGQKARAGHKIRPEWRDIIKKIPKRRGESASGSLKSIQGPLVTLNVGVLEIAFASGDAVNPKSLVKMNVIERVKGKRPMVKILGDGELTKKLIVSDCTVSLSAKEKIVKAGGSVA
jgi:large subunit ribosomal protein L15